MDIPQPLIFLGIILIVPLQIYLSPQRSSDLDYYAVQLKTKIAKIWDEFTTESTEEIVSEEMKANAREEMDIETLFNKKEYFAAGNTPRDPRPPFVKFRVGDIVYHKLNKYRGVIIGWDTKANAPEYWLSRVRGSKKERDDSGPNYAVLIDTRFRAVPQLGYVMEKNIEKVEETSKIYHPLVKKYFERYNPADGTYIPRPYLREVYPND